MENNKPKAQQVDWSYPGELSAVDRPSLLRLLAPDTSIKTNASGSAAGIVSRTTSVAKNITARRPIHIPKRTRGLSEGSGLMHLEAEARHGLKRPLSDESDTSNTSGNSFTRKWEEIRKYMEDESGSSLKVKTPTKKVKVEPPAEITTGSGAFSQQPEVASHDYATDSDSDLDFSDTESIGSHSSFVEELLVSGKKDKRFFWQYNTQAKGPKGKRLCRNVETADPHVLNTFEDPVFDPEMNDAKYRHTGRARKGDGNDVTPSPWKLFQIGNQLKKLNKKIHDIAPPGDLPATVRNDSRREKNKFASRACRLKKKAQHEANKIKMYGLDTEHAELISVLNHIKGDIVQHNPTTDTSAPTRSESYIALYDRLVQQHLTAMIAGNTSDYVNSVLEKVAQGDRTGGLDLARR